MRTCFSDSKTFNIWGLEYQSFDQKKWHCFLSDKIHLSNFTCFFLSQMMCSSFLLNIFGLIFHEWIQMNFPHFTASGKGLRLGSEYLSNLWSFMNMSSFPTLRPSTPDNHSDRERNPYKFLFQISWSRKSPSLELLTVRNPLLHFYSYLSCCNGLCFWLVFLWFYPQVIVLRNKLSIYSILKFVRHKDISPHV